MNKSHTYSVSLLLIVFTVMILCSLFGDQIYKLTTPNVKAEVVKVAVWDNVKYNCVIEKDNIYEDSDGQYVFLIKNDNSFWYVKNHLERGNIRLLSENNDQVAVEFISQNYSSGDLIAAVFIDEAGFYSDVYVVE